MSRARWTTRIGVALGGTGGAIAAFMGAPKAPAPVSPAPRVTTAAAAPTPTPVSSIKLAPPPDLSIVPAASSAAAVSASAAPSAAPPAPAAVPTDMPTTLEALTTAMVRCDQKKDFDACTRAAFALDLGSTGPADPEQAKRFRKIAITHLVTQCEGGWAHACFVLAAKYRAGTELPKSENSAAILEKRAIGLCRHNAAPECPQ